MTSMRSGRDWTSSSNRLLQRAWATMGLPFDAEMIDENSDGTLDVECLLIATFLVMGQDRSASDVPAWTLRFGDLINHQKLKGLFGNLSSKHRERITGNLALFQEMPRAFRNIFSQGASGSKARLRGVESRMSRLDSLEHIARRSVMIRNRLLYGTGFRADLISLLQVRGLKVNARQMSRLLCAADSTISRLLRDLRAGQLIDRNNEMRGSQETFPSLFLSAFSVSNLVNLLDAQEFRSEELRRSAAEELDTRFDGFTRALLAMA
jgi:hypothetical protein